MKKYSRLSSAAVVIGALRVNSHNVVTFVASDLLLGGNRIWMLAGPGLKLVYTLYTVCMSLDEEKSMTLKYSASTTKLCSCYGYYAFS